MWRAARSWRAAQLAAWSAPTRLSQAMHLIMCIQLDSCHVTRLACCRSEHGDSDILSLSSSDELARKSLSVALLSTKHGMADLGRPLQQRYFLLSRTSRVYESYPLRSRTRQYESFDFMRSNDHHEQTSVFRYHTDSSANFHGNRTTTAVATQDSHPHTALYEVFTWHRTRCDRCIQARTLQR